jgi:hypothetical protein
VWHKGLTEKLKSYGLSEGLVKWFQDYISNRKQILFINNSESRIGLLKAGVPQGSGYLIYLYHNLIFFQFEEGLLMNRIMKYRLQIVLPS